MWRTIRFHLDENRPRAVAAGLRRLGIDVTRHNEVGLEAASEEEQLAFSHSEGRVIFTQDPDLLALDRLGRDHHGVVYGAQGRRSIGEIIDGRILIWEVYEPEEMTGRIEYL